MTITTKIVARDTVTVSNGQGEQKMEKCPMNLDCDCEECKFAKPIFCPDGSIDDVCDESKITDFLAEMSIDLHQELAGATGREERNVIMKKIEKSEELCSAIGHFFYNLWKGLKMKKLLIISALIISWALQAKDVYEAIAIVESHKNDNAVGDKGKAIGRHQLWEVYVLDVNRISKKKYCSDDRKDPAKSLEMVKIYTGYYCERYTRLTGKEATAETIARIHNGGPNGWKKQTTEKYWNKIRKEMKK